LMVPRSFPFSYPVKIRRDNQVGVLFPSLLQRDLPKLWLWCFLFLSMSLCPSYIGSNQIHLELPSLSSSPANNNAKRSSPRLGPYALS